MDLKTPLPVALLLVSLIASPCSGGDSTTVQIALYPYYHEPAIAWRVTVLGDGTVLYEESKEPVEVRKPTRQETIKWVEQSPPSVHHLSRRKLGTLLSQLRELDLSDLQFIYTAEHSFTDPEGDRVEILDSGETRVLSSEATRVVTHGENYRLRITSKSLTVDSFVYAPVSALRHEQPQHPDRAEIAKIVAAWYYVLKAVGPVGDFNAKYYRRWVE